MRPRFRLATTAAAALTIPLLGCVSVASERPDTTGPRVSAAEQAALPTTEYVAAAELCPHDAGSARERAALRESGRRHLEAIVRSHRRHPDATVEMAYATDSSLTERGGPRTEVLTVTDLAAQWLRSLRAADCAPMAQRRLRALEGVRERAAASSDRRLTGHSSPAFATHRGMAPTAAAG